MLLVKITDSIPLFYLLAQDRAATQEAASTAIAASAAISRKSMQLKEEYYKARRDERDAAMDRMFGGSKKGKDKDKSFNHKVGASGKLAGQCMEGQTAASLCYGLTHTGAVQCRRSARGMPARPPGERTLSRKRSA